jgi:5-methylcytosine-specific restriction endonuclease McrA/ribosomal protein L21E
MPCSEKRARKLLESGRARVHKQFPFAIRLTDRFVEHSSLQPLRFSIDPGSKTTGMALCRVEMGVDSSTGEITAPVMHISFLMELVHRGQQIKDALKSRASLRRTRRNRNLRYRAPRFLNRGGDKTGWIAPSLMHRVLTTKTWVKRITKLAPVTHLAQELVKFDLQKMQAQAEGRDIAGVEYQQGTLFGYEVREYLLEKWGRQCMYCDKTGIPLQIEHIHPKSDGGSNRISNLGLACGCCNQKKGSLDVRDFVKDSKRLSRILVQAKRPLKDAAAVNSTRWVLFNTLKATGLPVAIGTGGQTKFNRTRLGIAKGHALDAACVGDVGDVRRPAQPVLQVKCNGRGSRCRTRVDAYGFPRGYLMRTKSIKGFRTGDMVRATVPTHNAKGKPVAKSGNYTGRVAVRASGAFNIQTPAGVIDSISHKYCTVIMRGDGYSYSTASNYQSHSRSSPTKLDGSASRTTPTRPANLEGVPCEKT